MAILNLDGLKRVVENIKSHFSDINHVHDTLDIGDVGSSTTPVYFDDGVATPVGSSLAVDITGNSATATKLKNTRTVRTNLASTSTASFDGSANITPGVTGILPVANGGTGSSTEKYLPLSGGTISGDLTVSGTLSAGSSGSGATITVRHYTAAVSASDTASFSYASGSASLDLSGDTLIKVGCSSGCATTCVSGCSGACVTACSGCSGCSSTCSSGCSSTCSSGCNSDSP